MSKVRVLDTFVRGTNVPIEIDVEELYTYWRFEGVNKVSVVSADGKGVKELPTYSVLDRYDSILYNLNDVCGFLNKYANIIGIPLKLVSGENIVLGKRMRKATRVELDGANYGNGGTPVIVVNPNAMRGYGNIGEVLSQSYITRMGLTTKQGKPLPHTLIAEGVGNYIYDVYIAPKIKGRKDNLPVYLTKEEYVKGFILMYSSTMFNVRHDMPYLRYKGIEEKMKAFINAVRAVK